MAGHEKLSLRFGGIEKRDDGDMHIGAAILAEGPGGGFYSLPWVLDDYERAMNLTPVESWLLRRMLKYDWKGDTLVYISMSKVSEQAVISKPTLWKAIKQLRLKGFIREVRRGAFANPVVYYDVSNVWRALWCCIQCSPFSKLRADGRGWNVERAKAYAAQHGFELDWAILRGDQLSERAERKRTRSHDKERIEVLKRAIDDAFAYYEPFNWYAKKNWAALKDMAAAGVTPAHIVKVAKRLDDMPDSAQGLADIAISQLNGRRRR